MKLVSLFLSTDNVRAIDPWGKDGRICDILDKSPEYDIVAISIGAFNHFLIEFDFDPNIGEVIQLTIPEADCFTFFADDIDEAYLVEFCVDYAKEHRYAWLNADIRNLAPYASLSAFSVLTTKPESRSYDLDSIEIVPGDRAGLTRSQIEDAIACIGGNFEILHITEEKIRGISSPNVHTSLYDLTWEQTDDERDALLETDYAPVTDILELWDDTLPFSFNGLGQDGIIFAYRELFGTITNYGKEISFDIIADSSFTGTWMSREYNLPEEPPEGFSFEEFFRDSVEDYARLIDGLIDSPIYIKCDTVCFFVVGDRYNVTSSMHKTTSSDLEMLCESTSLDVAEMADLFRAALEGRNDLLSAASTKRSDLAFMPVTGIVYDEEQQILSYKVTDIETYGPDNRYLWKEDYNETIRPVSRALLEKFASVEIEGKPYDRQALYERYRKSALDALEGAEKSAAQESWKQACAKAVDAVGRHAKAVLALHGIPDSEKEIQQLIGTEALHFVIELDLDDVPEEIDGFYLEMLDASKIRGAITLPPSHLADFLMPAREWIGKRIDDPNQGSFSDIA